MNLVRWTRFTWDLRKLPPLEDALRPPYALRPAARQEETLVSGMIHSAFSLDSDWSDKFNLFREPLQHQLRVAFERETIPALVITHGQRIIGASILNTDVDADSHLISGPCVLVEYRNRGLGTVLLYYSLKQLQNAGLSVVHGVSKDNVPAAKFIYPKFGARRVVWEFEPALTAH
ncbi:MAG: GNAT family N-acetyltransferase [Verrucomicrobiota bacterium]|nr:GNAT family N-acetyltransferase [Verrucomicrobiota bacterium]